jgi:hypothetical protein
MRKDTGATTYNMKRLLLTETARVQTLASKRHMLEVVIHDVLSFGRVVLLSPYPTTILYSIYALQTA